MQVNSVSSNTPNFKASLATTKEVRRLFNTEPFESAIIKLEKKLESCPEKDVFVISKMPEKEAKDVQVVRYTSDPKYKNFLYDNEVNDHDKVPFTEKENLKVSVNGKSCGFYMNSAEDSGNLANWLFKTYQALKG